MLRSPDELSDGQRYRFALAVALAGGAKTIVADEWCAKLDRVTAKVISHNARKIADRRGVGNRCLKHRQAGILEGRNEHNNQHR